MYNGENGIWSTFVYQSPSSDFFHVTNIEKWIHVVITNYNAPFSLQMIEI